MRPADPTDHQPDRSLASASDHARLLALRALAELDDHRAPARRSRRPLRVLAYAQGVPPERLEL
jgi:hypothetical protein